MAEPYFKNKTFGVIAPAGRVDNKKLVQAVETWLSWHAGVKIMPHVSGFESDFFSAPATMRAADINMAFADDEIDFVICARGGYGCAELHDLIDWEMLAKNPKVLIGYSDITALHQMMLKHGCGIPVSGAMFLRAGELFTEDADNYKSFLNALTGEKQILKTDAEVPFCGKCVVANLAVLSSLCGTELLSDFSGKCLILEDLNEPPYKIHRMLNQLAQAGIFDSIAAIASGEFMDCGEGYEIEKIFRTFADRYSLPYYSGLPIGHGNKIHAVNMLADIMLY